MSSWVAATVRGLPADEYDLTREDHPDPWDATADIAATMNSDDKVREWTTWNGHAYAYLTVRSDWEDAEAWLTQYEPMAQDAVILRANDTTDVGTARYYPTASDYHRHEYAESQEADGLVVGEVALAVMTAAHGVVARDPWHNRTGTLDDSYLRDGKAISDYKVIDDA